ncbi:MAG: MFS transporter [Pyrinomonadaceae bacterium]
MKISDRARKNITLAAMCIATFIAILDTTVVNLAVPYIQTGLGVMVNILQWIIDAYTLIYASFIMTGGALGDLFGRRRIFVYGIILFIIGSLMCALAPDTAWLIAGRIVAGFGAALELPVALSILTVTFDEAERPRAISIWGGFSGLAMAVGPTAGGFLIDQYGWRSIFYIVIPFGIAVLILTYIGVKESSDPEKRKVDWLGQLFVVLFLGPMTFAFIEAPVSSWTSPLIIGSLLVSVVSFISFLVVEHREPNGLVSIDVFKNRAFSAALIITALITFGFYGLLFVFPIYSQKVRGLSATLTGVVLLPLSLTFFFISFFAGGLLKRLGPRLVITISMVIYGTGFFVVSFLDAESSYAIIFPGLFMIGLAAGLVYGPLMIVAVSSVAKERSGMSSGLLNVGRMVGATLGVAILGLIFGSQGIQDTTAAKEFLSGMHNTLLIGGCACITGAILALVFIKREITVEV